VVISVSVNSWLARCAMSSKCEIVVRKPKLVSDGEMSFLFQPISRRLRWSD